MSMPISRCLIIRAAKGDDVAFEHLISAMTYNASFGGFTMFPCKCNPPCEEATENEIDALNERIERAMEEK